MLNEEFFEKLKERIQPYYEIAGGHEIDHTERVYRLCLTIAETEKVDLDVLRAAALLHDIARKKQEEMKNTICHAKEGAKIAKEILLETDFPKEKVDDVVYAIEVHRYSHQIKPKTKEAEILQDADRLESLGAIIIGRIFSYNGKMKVKMYDPEIKPREKYNGDELSTAINFFHEKIFNLKPESFNTKKGREMAVGRYNFVKEYLERFIREWEGKE